MVSEASLNHRPAALMPVFYPVILLGQLNTFRLLITKQKHKREQGIKKECPVSIKMTINGNQ